MRKLCLFLALLLLLSGCGKTPGISQPTEPSSHTTQPTVPSAVVTEPTEQAPEAVPVVFDIYAVNDLHGKLADTDAQPGVDELSTYLKQAQQTGNTIFLSTGDMWQGASESNLTDGLIVTEWMNQTGFAAMTLGGHEYDWGEDTIRKNAQMAQFPFLGINVYSRTTNTQADYCQSSLVIDRDGVQIGIIGAIGNCYYSISSEQTKDVYFKIGDELTALVKAEAEKLRSQGVDFIIYTIHDGFDQTSGAGVLQVADRELESYYDISLSDGYVDLVFEADSHFWYVLEDSRGVYHLQSGGNNAGISHATVAIDPLTGQASVLTAELLPASKYSYMEDDPVVDRLLEKYAEQISPSAQILGSNAYYRNQDYLCRLVAYLYRNKGVEKWGAEYDIVLGGGYISCRSPGYLPAGEVSYSQLQALLPFDNQITLCSIRGSDLISRFLENDHYAYHILTTEYGDSLQGNIDPDGIYYVVTDTYSAYYSYNNMTVIDTYAEDIFARDLLADYIAAGGLG